jgi:hypothetical protein
VSKAKYQVKQLKLTEHTQAWLEAECAKHPEKKPQQILRERLHEIAMREIHGATVLNGIVARLGIRGDGGGSSE